MPYIYGGDGETYIPRNPADYPQESKVGVPVASPPFIGVVLQARTYQFSHGNVTITGVIGFYIDNAGTHYLQTTGDKRHVIPTGWYHLEIDAPHYRN